MTTADAMTTSARIVLRGATIVDGTGSPGFAGDVSVVDGAIELVAPPGTIETAGATVVDLDGLVLAPGFIDPHTHLDAQVLWDPDLTPSSWHGVTSVVVGNCGFGVAPTRPADRDTVIRTLENVEGMSADALRAGIAWTFETFAEYLDAVAAAQPRLNMAVMLGHTPLRLFVMGSDAIEREATADEVDEMCEIVETAMAAGAVGFATSRSANHQGAYGRPVPSRLASMDEVVALARAANKDGRRIVQFATGPGLKEASELIAFAERIDAPITWTALLADAGKRGESVAKLADSRRTTAELWGQIACRPIVTQTTLRTPTTFGMCPAFAEILGLPLDERAARYRDMQWRDRARVELNAQWGHRWNETTVQESSTLADRTTSVAVLASQQGVDPVDYIIDLALADDLETRYRIVLLNDDEDEITELMHADGALLALSDAGAHANVLCDACYTTDLLGHWVRDKHALTMELAIWHLTGHPAEVFGLTGRGTIRAGAAADLVAFDPARVSASALERVWDLPGGADRLIAFSTGIEHVWINGVPVRREGNDLPGVRPGQVLRSGSAVVRA